VETPIDRYASANDIRVHLLDHPGGDPPIVLLPGITANVHNFDGLINAGLAPRFRVVGLDLRGRGLSDKPAQGYSIAEHAADVIGVLDALALDRVVLGGHSFGALLTAFVAARYPERVSQCIFIDIALTPSDPKVGEAIRPSLERLGRPAASFDAYVKEIQAAPYLQGRWDPIIEAYYRADVETREDGSVITRTKPEHIFQVAMGVQAEDWPAIFATVQQPSIFFSGPMPVGGPGTPAVISAEAARAAAAVLPDCRQFVEVPGNHWTMVYGEGARQSVAAVGAFLGR
jgi:pimeloyl-ACP methyl ester carboxylesterase